MANEVAKKEPSKRFKLKTYLKEMMGEVKKLTWLSGKDLVKNTAMVLVFVLVMSGVIWVLDYAFSAGVKGLANVTAPAATVEPVASEEAAAPAEAETEAPAEAETEAPAEAETEAPAEAETPAEQPAA